MNGYFNRILRVDLSAKRFSCDHLPDSVLKEALGGKGLGVRLLLRESPRGVDPLAPENPFVIVSGPLTGTKMWGSARFGVFSKSPATGGYGESYCGGTLAARLKGCGVDAVVLTGRCPSLSWLLIGEGGVIFGDAEEMGGADTAVTEERVLRSAAEHLRSGDAVRRGVHTGARGANRPGPPGVSVMSIGPAGENRVRLACIKCDRWRSLGRGGLGAVLGAKNVKAIAFSGSRTPEPADEGLLKEVIRSIARKGKESPVTEVYRRFGTPSQVAVTNAAACFPTRYWRAGRLEGWERLSAETMQRDFEVESRGCPNCFLRCTKRSRVLKGRHEGLVLEGPEYETIYAIGGLNAITSLEEVAFLNDLCDRLGLDTMSAGNLAGLAVEAHRRGKSDFPIHFGEPDKIAELFRLIARREGIGGLLAEGIKSVAAEWGLEDVAVHVKGLEPAGFDPRVLKGMGLSYATAARGACHLRGTFYKAELSGQVDRDKTAGKAEALIDYEDRAALFDCLILCRFFRDFIGWDELSGLVAASTGRSLGKRELELLANDVTQNTRRFNRREGLAKEDDGLPARLLREPTAEGARLTAEELTVMIEEYDSIRGRRDEEKAARAPV